MENPFAPGSRNVFDKTISDLQGKEASRRLEVDHKLHADLVHELRLLQSA